MSVPEASLQSLTTDTSAILNGLLKPGMMSDKVEEDERRASVTRWQNIIGTPAKIESVSPRMPGTLYTPTVTKSSLDPDGPSSVIVDTKDSLHFVDEQGKPVTRMPSALPTPSNAKLAEPSADLPATQEDLTASQGNSASSHHLMRSMSLEEREAFLNDLVQTCKAPPASVFVLPMDEILGAKQSAIKRGFHCHVHDLENGDGWLIIGMDSQAVESLFEGIEGRAEDRMNGGGGGFKAAMGGAIAGSVATWTTLAYA
jgi:hypothetical protein